MLSMLSHLAECLPCRDWRRRQELIDAMEIACEELRQSQQLHRRILKKVDKGQPLTSALIATGPAEIRQSFDEAMEGVTTLRHHTRSLVFALAVEEGLSIGEVARNWGVSRQLASRYVREGSQF
jgi:hypothetical protein